MISGWVRFQTSGGSPNWRPFWNSIVPIAPSAMTGPPLREELAEAGAGRAAVDREAGLAVGERGGIDRGQRLRAAGGGR